MFVAPSRQHTPADLRSRLRRVNKAIHQANEEGEAAGGGVGARWSIGSTKGEDDGERKLVALKDT